MTLTEDIRDQLEAFAHGAIPATQLEAWLDSVIDEIHQADEPWVHEITDQAFALLYQVHTRVRPEAEARHELLHLLTVRS